MSSWIDQALNIELRPDYKITNVSLGSTWLLANLISLSFYLTLNFCSILVLSLVHNYKSKQLKFHLALLALHFICIYLPSVPLLNLVTSFWFYILKLDNWYCVYFWPIVCVTYTQLIDYIRVHC